MPCADLFVPAPELLFPIVEDWLGPRLVLVFGNEAPRGECPFYRAGLCYHCDIGGGEGVRFDAGANRRRLAWFRAHYRDELPRIAHLVLYNSGSVLNPVEMAPEFLEETIAFARGLPVLSAVSLDTREIFVNESRIVALARALGAPRALRPIIGIESADDAIRNGLLDKRMKRAAIERAVAALGAAARTLEGEPEAAGIGLEVNLVVGGPGAAGDRAVEDARATARYALGLAARAGLALGLNLHPYYPSARGEARFPGHSRPSRATVIRAAAAVLDECRASGAEAAVFLGLHDEGHDHRPEERAAEVFPLRAALDEFHRRQDARALEERLA